MEAPPQTEVPPSRWWQDPHEARQQQPRHQVQEEARLCRARLPHRSREKPPAGASLDEVWAD